MRIFRDLKEIPETIPEAVEYYSIHLGLFIVPVNSTDSSRFSKGQKKVLSKWGRGAIELPLEALKHKCAKGGGIGFPLPRNLMVLDIDLSPHRDGYESLFELMYLADAPESDLETLTVLTPSGGAHLYYRGPFDHNVSGFSTGIDLRTGGKGLVMLPPSYGPKFDKQYYFDLRHQEAIPIPAFIASGIFHQQSQINLFVPDLEAYGDIVVSSSTSKLGKSALRFNAACITQSPHGTRNNNLNAYAYRTFRLVASGHVSLDDATNRLWDAAVLTQLEPSEISATLESAYRAGILRPLGPAGIKHLTNRLGLGPGFDKASPKEVSSLA